MAFKAPRIYGYKKTDVLICEYCGQYSVRTHHRQKYCAEPKKCRYYARLDKKNEYSKKYYENKKVKKQPLGTSNLREHSDDDFENEWVLVRKEIHRLLGYKD